MPPSRLWLIRHAESVWNATGRWQGQADPPLSELGRQQAALLATRLATLAPAAIYTSDLRRCMDTAAPTAAATGLAARPRRALREIDVGAWSGLTRAEIEAGYPEEWARMLAGVDVRRGGGESTAELAARVREFAAELATNHDGETVVVFSHGGWIREALAHYLRQRPTGPRRLTGIGNTSLTEVISTPSGYHLTTFADRSHLTPLTTTETAATAAGTGTAEGTGTAVPEQPPPPPSPLRPAPATGYTPDV